MCPPGCGMELEGDGLVHVTESHQVSLAEIEAVPRSNRQWKTRMQLFVFVYTSFRIS